MTTRDGRYRARNLRPEPPSRATRHSDDASDRLTKLQARMSHLRHRSNELQRASAQLHAHSRELLARAHEHVLRASVLPSQCRAEVAGRTSDGGIE